MITSNAIPMDTTTTAADDLSALHTAVNEYNSAPTSAYVSADPFDYDAEVISDWDAFIDLLDQEPEPQTFDQWIEENPKQFDVMMSS